MREEGNHTKIDNSTYDAPSDIGHQQAFHPVLTISPRVATYRFIEVSCLEKEETHEEEHVEEKEDKTSEELESLRKELEESKKLIAELQDANRKRNRDDGSIKSDEDLMNDIMLDMY